MGLRNKFYRLGLYYTYICLVFCELSYLMESYYAKKAGTRKKFLQFYFKELQFFENYIVIYFKFYNLFMKEFNNLNIYVL